MTNKKLLIIEDSRSDRLLIENALNSTIGNAIDKAWASSIAETKQILLDQKIDIIILDLNLEDSSGFDTLLNINQFTNDIPIIIFTGSPDESLRYKSLSTGIRGYLKKGDNNSYLDLAELIISVIQQSMVRHCALTSDCPQNINSIKVSLTNLIISVDELKRQVQNLNGKIIGNGTIGYGTRIEKLENFRNNIVKYWWILFPIVATAIIGSFFI